MQMMAQFLLLFVSIFIAVTYAKSVQLSLRAFNSTRFPLAVCNDGTIGGFYFLKSPSSSSNWLVHLMGGGWCWDNESCQERASKNAALTTNKQWTPTINKTGVFDDNSTLNPLHDANKIFVPYCTSDAYMGYRHPSPSSNNWYFMGQQVVEAVLLTLAQDSEYDFGSSPNRDTLIFSGCSAGGRGAMVNLDYLPSIIKSNGIELKSLFGILDSGLYVNVQPLAPYSTELSVGNQTKSVYTYQNCSGRVDGSKCGDFYTSPDEKWKCLFGEYKIPLLAVDAIVNAAQFDAYQMGVDLGWNNPMIYTDAQKEYAEGVFRAATREVVLNNISSNILSTSCYHHCTSEEIEYWNVTANGVSFAEMIRKYMNGDRENGNKWIGNCTNGINCGQGCNPITQPF